MKATDLVTYCDVCIRRLGGIDKAVGLAGRHIAKRRCPACGSVLCNAHSKETGRMALNRDRCCGKCHHHNRPATFKEIA